MTIKEQKAALIEAVELTDEEWEEAIREGKRKKFFHIKHKLHWECTANAGKDQKTRTPENAQAAPENDEKRNQ